MTELQLMKVRADLGMVFQEGALFDSLTVAENVGYKLYEETDMPADQVRSRVEEVLGFIGLGEFSDRIPSDLSGGQRRRVAIARAMAASRGSSSTTNRRQVSTRSRPTRSTMRSSSFATWRTSARSS